MSNRHLARTIAMQTLYQWDFLGRPEGRIEEIMKFCKAEFASNFDDGGFIKELVDGTITNMEQVDAILAQFAPEWPLDAMTVVDRNILRLGCYELRFSPSVPSKVAINEAIELAKGFGGEKSGQFVNGVLGAIYKDMVATGTTKDIDKAPVVKKVEEVQSATPL